MRLLYGNNYGISVFNVFLRRTALILAATFRVQLL